MRVYLLMTEWTIENVWPLGIYSSKEKAEEAIRIFQQTQYHQEMWIEEFDMDAVELERLTL